MARSTLTCLQRIHWRFRSMKAAPDVRMRSAISSAGEVTGAPPPQRDPHLYQIRLAITAPLVKRSVRRRVATFKTPLWEVAKETRFIENGFVARVRAVGVVYWSAFTSITACLELFHQHVIFILSCKPISYCRFKRI